MAKRDLADVEVAFAVNDVVAIGAMTAFRDAGPAPGTDIDVAGFADIATTMDVCHGTIHQAIYHGGRSGLCRTLTKKLRTRRPTRKRRRRPDERRSRFLAPHLLIEYRPAVVEERRRIGAWEGDLIIGAGSRSAIGTMVDRASRYLRLVHLPGARTAEALRDALIATLIEMPDTVRWTLTCDQGTEMACHLSQDQLAAPPGRDPDTFDITTVHQAFLHEKWPAPSRSPQPAEPRASTSATSSMSPPLIDRS